MRKDKNVLFFSREMKPVMLWTCAPTVSIPIIAVFILESVFTVGGGAESGFQARTLVLVWVELLHPSPAWLSEAVWSSLIPPSFLSTSSFRCVCPSSNSSIFVLAEALAPLARCSA